MKGLSLAPKREHGREKGWPPTRRCRYILLRVHLHVLLEIGELRVKVYPRLSRHYFFEQCSPARIGGQRQREPLRIDLGICRSQILSEKAVFFFAISLNSHAMQPQRKQTFIECSEVVNRQQAGLVPILVEHGRVHTWTSFLSIPFLGLATVGQKETKGKYPFQGFPI